LPPLLAYLCDGLLDRWKRRRTETTRKHPDAECAETG